MTPKRQMREKKLAGRALPYAKLRLLSIVREIISIRSACAGAQAKKAGRQEVRKVTRSV